MVPCAELVRYTCSGTEATMHVIRLAREYTGRDIIVKFEGHFHGYHDYVQYSWSPPIEKIGSSRHPIPYPQSGGIPEDMVRYIRVLPFNDIEAVKETFNKEGKDIAAVIMEPINYNSGCILPPSGFVKELQQLTQRENILLIFDEVLSAFRMCRGGGQEYLGITPDLCTIGKSVAGGTPLSIFAGKRKIMKHVRPLGTSEHSGTYTGHLIPVMAALASLSVVDTADFFSHINKLGSRFKKGMDEIIQKLDVPVRVQLVGARFGIYFGVTEEVTNYRQAAKHDQETFLKFVKAAIENGVYFHDYGGKACHHGFSIAHTLNDINRALEGIEKALKKAYGK